MIWFILHLILIIFIWLSPFLLSWKLEFIGVLLFLTYSLAFNSCFLSRLQFGDDQSFYQHYLRYIGLDLNKSHITLIFGRLLPLILFLTSVFWQVVLKNDPYLRF